MKQRLSLLLSLSCLTLSQGIFLRAATAQVTADGTTNTTVDVSGNDFTINQGDRAGGNLFHSFRDFSVPTDGSAFFDNPADIVNIFSRVTGGNISNIDGLLRANGAANLFLINPVGIIFGEGARLDIGGSFLGSTADSIVFSNGEFSATDLNNPPLITINAPIGLNLRDNPGNIVNRSTVQNSAGDIVGLEVAPEETLAFIGGNINFEGGQITAPGANVWLGGLSESGTVSISDNFDLSLPDGIARADISFSNAAEVNTAADNAGGINVIGNNVTFTGDSQFFGGIAENDGFEGAKAGDININATGAVNLSGESTILNRVNEGATGNSGDINVTAQSLTLTEGSFFSTSIVGQGDAGTISVTANESITFDGSTSDGTLVSGIFNTVFASAIGNSGEIEVTTNNIEITNGAEISNSTFGQGDAGTISVTANESISLDGSTSDGTIVSGIFNTVNQGAIGNGGGIEVITNNLEITNGAQISASIGGQGDGGTISVTANESITFDGSTSDGTIVSGIFNTVNQGAIGNSESIEVTTNNLSITNGALISASTFGIGQGGQITVNANSISLSEGSGIGTITSINSGDIDAEQVRGGDIELNVSESLSMTGVSSITSGTVGTGDAGNITINGEGADLILGDNVPEGEENIESSGFGAIFSSSIFNLFGDISSFPDRIGNAGDITITAKSLTLREGSLINTGVSIQGNAETISNSGNISINVRETLTISGFNENTSFVTSIATNLGAGVEGKAGDITITAGSLSLENGGFIDSSTRGQGNSGTISVTANESISLDGTTTTSNGTFRSGFFSTVNQDAIGNGGGIEVTTNNLELTNGAAINASTSGQGNSGTISVTVNESISLDGAGTSISTRVQPTGSGNGGQVTITANSLFLTEGAEILTETFGQGDAGNIIINANDSVNISGVAPFPRLENGDPGGFSSGLIANTDEGAVGQGGGIIVTTPQLTLSDGGVIAARSRSDFAGGNITVNADNLEIAGGGQIQAAAFSNGSAGNINLNINNQITIDGSDPTFQERFNSLVTNFNQTEAEERIDPVSPESGIFANTISGSSGNGGNISIGIFDSEGVFDPTQFTKEITLSNQGTIAADSEGTGSGGIITIHAENLNLDAGEISATTTTRQEGDNSSLSTISLLVDDNLILSNNSEISAEATNNADGGNININAGFIVGFPSSGLGSDIRTNAGLGAGGNINIITQGLLGFEESKGTAGLQNDTNDIDASSEFGLDGVVIINSPDTNALQSTDRLPTNPVSAETIATEACSPREGGSSLTYQGKGGVPPEPTAPLSADALIPNGKPITLDKETDLNSFLVEETETEQLDPYYLPPDIKPIKTSRGDIYPARGIIKTEDGKIILTSYPTDNTNPRTPHNSANCTP